MALQASALIGAGNFIGTRGRNRDQTLSVRLLGGARHLVGAMIEAPVMLGACQIVERSKDGRQRGAIRETQAAPAVPPCSSGHESQRR